VSVVIAALERNLNIVDLRFSTLQHELFYFTNLQMVKRFWAIKYINKWFQAKLLTSTQ